MTKKKQIGENILSAVFESTVYILQSKYSAIDKMNIAREKKI